MYTYKTRVGFSQLSPNARLAFTAVVDMFQDCANFHSQSLGEDVEYFRKINKVWVLSAWQIILKEPAVMGDVLEVGTNAYEFTSVFGMRNFLMKKESGQTVAMANSYWALVDAQTGHPLRVTDEDARPYITGEKPLDMEYAPRKIRLKKELAVGEPMRVQRCHLDTNNHVNNSRYFQFAMECLPDDFELGQVRAEYKTSARYGDVIVPCWVKEDDRVSVALKDKECGRVFAAVEFERRKQNEYRNI